MRRQRLISCCAVPSAVVLLILAYPFSARAGFVGGVENFSGTTLDTATWQLYSNLGGAPSQNNKLTLTTPTGVADYTTKTFSVGIGQTVRSSFQLNSVGSNFGAQLSLIGGPVANQDWSNYATAFTLWSVDQGGGNTIFNFEYSLGGNAATTTLPLHLNTTYTYQISYDSASSVTGSVYDSSNTLLGSYSYTGLSGLPSTFLIDVSNQNSTATFANVVVTPEPTLSALCACIAPVILHRRRRIAADA